MADGSAARDWRYYYDEAISNGFDAPSAVAAADTQVRQPPPAAPRAAPPAAPPASGAAGLNEAAPPSTGGKTRWEMDDLLKSKRAGLLSPTTSKKAERKSAQELFELGKWSHLLHPGQTADAIEARRKMMAGETEIAGRGQADIETTRAVNRTNAALIAENEALTKKQLELNANDQDLSDDDAKKLKENTTAINKNKADAAKANAARGSTDPKLDGFIDGSGKIRADVDRLKARNARWANTGKRIGIGLPLAALTGYGLYEAGKYMGDERSASDGQADAIDIQSRLVAGEPISPEERQLLVESFPDGMDGERIVLEMEAYGAPAPEEAPARLPPGPPLKAPNSFDPPPEAPRVELSNPFGPVEAGTVSPSGDGAGMEDPDRGFWATIGDDISARGAFAEGRIQDWMAPYVTGSDYQPVEEPDIERAFTNEQIAKINADPNYTPEEKRAALVDLQSNDIYRANSAMTGANLENTASVAGLPEPFMDYIRNSRDYAYKDQQGEAPVDPENWWNKYIAIPTAEAAKERDARLARDQSTWADPNNPTLAENPMMHIGQNYLPSGVYDYLNESQILNPSVAMDNLLGSAESWKNMPYDLASRALSIGSTPYSMEGDAPGAQPKGFYERSGLSPIYDEWLAWSGGQPLVDPDAPTADVAAGRPDFIPPPDLSFDQNPEVQGGGTGVSQTAPPSFAELQQYEQMGILGRNPDGSNKTAAQYAAENQIAITSDNSLPAVGPIPEASLLTDSRRDPRRDPRQLPMANTVRPEMGIGSMPGAPVSNTVRPEMGIGEMPRGAPRTIDDLPPGSLKRSDLEALEATGGLGRRKNGDPVTVEEFITKGGAAGRGMDESAADTGAEERNKVALDILKADEAITPVGMASTDAPPTSTGGLGELLGFGAANAGTMPDGSTPAPIGVPLEERQGWGKEGNQSFTNWATYGMLGDENVNDDYPTSQAPELMDGGLQPEETPSTTAATTTSVVASPNGPQGDFGGSKGSTSAGLADNAAAAEEELNWINRMMRDKMGMTDASSRNKAAQALITGGAAMLASKGDGWQALGEGLQAGYGTVAGINADEAAAASADYETQQKMMLEDSKFRQQLALQQLRMSAPGSQEKEFNFYYQMAIDNGMSEQEAQQSAMDQIQKISPEERAYLDAQAGAG